MQPIIMTTNSFGSALPRFDFPRQPAAPKLTAQVARAFPTVAIVATAGRSQIQPQFQLTNTNLTQRLITIHITMPPDGNITCIHILR